MRVLMVLIWILFLPILSVNSQELQRYWVFFSDVVDEVVDDRFPPDEYVDATRSITDSITVRSRWLNAVSVPATAAQVERIRTLPFVNSVQPVARMTIPKPVPQPRRGTDELMTIPGVQEYYGHSETQIKLHGIDILHSLGITGQGVVIGFLDTGYRWDQHIGLQNARVIGERDFVAEQYPGDSLPGSHYSHGTLVFSVVAGFEPGTFIGVAHDAEFLLGATEDIRSETPIEEDFWVAGIEWMDEMGVDIVSTSLGYSTFDFPHESYTPINMDGKTAVTTIAADRAFERGILVVASAGNEGNSTWRIITSPADGKNVIATGAMDEFGNIASFSSRGPSADGRIKPDITAMGISVAGALVGTSGYRLAAGTSLSAPIVSGTAGLIRSARPDLTVEELRHALQMSARRNGSPDNTFGFGILDAPATLAFPVKRVTAGDIQSIESFLAVPGGLMEESVTIHIRTTNEYSYSIFPLQLTGSAGTTTSGLYRHLLDDRYHDQSLRFIITAHDSSGNIIRYPRGVSEEFHLSPVSNLITVDERIIPERFTLHQNYPNPFNNRTVIRFELPHDANLSVGVYDLLGRRVALLANDFFLAGVHEITWEPTRQASGMYFYTVQYGDIFETGRMIYIR